MEKRAHGQGFLLALLAGTMAALGSVFAKLAFNGDIISNGCNSMMDTTLCSKLKWYLQGLCFGMIFVSNALMWTCFTKSLQLCTSSLEATVINTATNFVVSALIGWMFFQEYLSLKWWLGSILILLGLVLIHRGSGHQTVTQKHHKDS
ncbi:transmembrane protein 42-like isoform X2 [Pecten maximus]|uniref:transmembrane protein 42-like isoform X1 n=1 Tax=Pecten maximus TaxID=6579 RepID=UPI001458D5FE|nr:transmembrane protein 42-like isoform X1 [Pecten maximus]XP_033754098.1 transmembrane protein 42-like isoform X1 [Pecten maximus]XP_033754099.1 transmembrane protein 42-like isoform X1 [Pecten maximus]XP_033754100.1 transmembrane protein 42-like isoform X2 [Pecten maximus]